MHDLTLHLTDQMVTDIDRARDERESRATYVVKMVETHFKFRDDLQDAAKIRDNVEIIEQRKSAPDAVARAIALARKQPEPEEAPKIDPRTLPLADKRRQEYELRRITDPGRIVTVTRDPGTTCKPYSRRGRTRLSLAEMTDRK